YAEERFEAYRKLGEHLATKAFEEAMGGADGPAAAARSAAERPPAHRTAPSPGGRPIRRA
ncbi:MAG TPA: hypothetical protein VK875_11475, partial [Euzebyales bacterium]|nr:hypothetical protein [Euzebyales bacterium]